MEERFFSELQDLLVRYGVSIESAGKAWDDSGLDYWVEFVFSPSNIVKVDLVNGKRVNVRD